MNQWRVQRGAKGAMAPIKPKIHYKFEDKFLRSSENSARSARSIVLYLHSFTLKMAVLPVIATAS